MDLTRTALDRPLDMSLFDAIEPDDLYCKEIRPNRWLMDNHRWAFYVWERYIQENKGIQPLRLVHVDYHWDGINNFNTPYKRRSLRSKQDLSSMYRLVCKDKDIRYDSFIAPAAIRGSIDEIHFFGYQYTEEPGLDNDICRKYRVHQTIHSTIEELVNTAIRSPFILDFDLDLFNRSEVCWQGDLWPDQDIIRFMHTCESLIRGAALTTIAISFDCSGTEDDAKHLAKLAVPLLAV